MYKNYVTRFSLAKKLEFLWIVRWLGRQILRVVRGWLDWLACPILRSASLVWEWRGTIFAAEIIENNAYKRIYHEDKCINIKYSSQFYY